MNYSPAFPITNHWHNELNHYNGMTLRDYMAAKAMQGMMHDVDQPHCDYIAQKAYQMADAMMKARES
jgi:hypothetical protein